MYKSVTDDLVSDPSKNYVSACLKQLIVDEVNSSYGSFINYVDKTP